MSKENESILNSKKEIEHLNKVMDDLKNAYYNGDIKEEEYIYERERINYYLNGELEKIKNNEGIITANKIINEEQQDVIVDEERIKKARANIKHNTLELEKLANIVPRDDLDRKEMAEEKRRREEELAKDRQIAPLEVEEIKITSLDDVVPQNNNVFEEPVEVKNLSIPQEPEMNIEEDIQPIVPPVEGSNDKVIELPEASKEPEVDASTPSAVIDEDKNPFIPKIDTLEDEEEVEVVKTSKWNWLKRNKKKILITSGISALGVAVVVGMKKLIPAYVLADTTSRISQLASGMIDNAKAWHTAQPVEQISLHSANTAFAKAIEGLSGKKTNYTSSTGIWTIGGQELNNFFETSKQTALEASHKLSKISKVAAALGLSGLGLTSVGVLLNKSSDLYLEYSNDIKESMDMKELGYVATNIMNDKRLSDKEKNKLLKLVKKEYEKIEREEREYIKNLERSIGR